MPDQSVVCDMPLDAHVRQLATAGIAGIALFIASTVFMHLVQRDLSILNDAVSYYMNGAFGWVLGFGLIALGGGSLALCAALRATEPQSVAGRLALALWAMGTIIGGTFPPDARGSWDKPPSVSGMIHANAALGAFLALPVASLLLSKEIGIRSGSQTIQKILPVLGLASVIMLVVFFVSLAPVFSNRPPHLLGLSERVLLAVYAAWLSGAALAIRRSQS